MFELLLSITYFISLFYLCHALKIRQTIKQQNTENLKKRPDEIYIKHGIYLNRENKIRPSKNIGRVL